MILTFVTPLIADDYKAFQPLVLERHLEPESVEHFAGGQLWRVVHTESYGPPGGPTIILAYVWPDEVMVPSQSLWDCKRWKDYDPAQAFSLAVDHNLAYLTHSYHVNQEGKEPKFSTYLEEFIPVSADGTLMQPKPTDWRLGDNRTFAPRSDSSYSNCYLLRYDKQPALVAA